MANNIRVRFVIQKVDDHQFTITDTILHRIIYRENGHCDYEWFNTMNDDELIEWFLQYAYDCME